MNNVNISTDKDGMIVIKIDPKLSLGDSKSGKTIMVATTNGFSNLVTSTGMVSLSLNCTRAK